MSLINVSFKNFSSVGFQQIVHLRLKWACVDQCAFRKQIISDHFHTLVLYELEICGNVRLSVCLHTRAYVRTFVCQNVTQTNKHVHSSARVYVTVKKPTWQGTDCRDNNEETFSWKIDYEIRYSYPKII